MEMGSKYSAQRDWKLLGSSYIVGLLEHPDAFMQPIDVWLAMTGRPPLHDFEENERIRAGKILEAGIIRSFEIDFGLSDPLVQNYTFINPYNKYFCSTPDGVDLKNGIVNSIILEVKNVGIDRQYLWSDGVPDIYYTQCQWHLKNVNDWNIFHNAEPIDKCYLRALFGGNHFADYEIEQNKSFIDDLVEVANHFIEEFVIPEKEPPPDTSKEYSKFLSIYHPDVPDKSLKKAADAEIDGLIREWLELRDQIRELEGRLQFVKNKLERRIIDDNVYGYQSLHASIARYKVSGRANDAKILSYLVEKYGLESEVAALKMQQDFRSADYHVLNIYPKKN